MGLVRGFVRGSVLAVLGAVLSLVLVVGLSVGAVVHRVTDRDSVKGWFQDESVHEAALAGFLATPDRDTTPERELRSAELAVDLLGEVMTYETYVRVVDGFVDAVFDWLGGATDAPRVEIQLTDDPVALEAQLAAVIRDRIAALPVCQGPPPSPEELFEAQCRPTQLDLAAVDRELAAALRDGPFASVFEDGTLRTDPIEPTDIEDPEVIRAAFGVARWVPGVLVLAVLVVLGLAQLVIRDRRRGARYAGLTLLIAPTLVAVGLIVGWSQRDRVLGRLTDPDSAPTEEIGTLMTSVTSNVAGSLFLTSATWTLLVLSVGGALLLLSRRFGRSEVDRPVALTAAGPRDLARPTAPPGS